MSTIDVPAQSERASAAEDAALDALAMARLAPLSGLYLPWTSFSMRAAAIVDLLNEITLWDRRLIVECGSGNSTIYMARLLRKRGGAARLVSIEHEPTWAEATRKALKAEGLTGVAEVIDAPLSDGWYAKAAIPDLTDVGLLVVDGPPAYTEETQLSREPALDHFAPMLAADATIVLDDARRPGEQAVLAAWAERHDRTFELQPGGHAISASHLV